MNNNTNVFFGNALEKYNRPYIIGLLMIKAKLNKNGMINFPAKYRKKLNLKPGDEIGFLETPEGIVIVPIFDILTLTNPKEMPLAKEIIAEIHEERRKESKKQEEV
ncbi:MAG: AbrB/MazE/SpoVT family DNA-binding domain-containing protein [Candidatus Hodarchaeales archaeon]